MDISDGGHRLLRLSLAAVQAAGDNEQSARQAPLPLLRLEVAVNGHRFWAIVDCGASASYISPSAAAEARLPIQLLSHPTPVTYSNGAQGRCEGFLNPTVCAQRPQLCATHPLFVIALPTDIKVVLGLDWLHAAGAHVNFSTFTLQVGGLAWALADAGTVPPVRLNQIQPGLTSEAPQATGEPPPPPPPAAAASVPDAPVPGADPAAMDPDAALEHVEAGGEAYMLWVETGDAPVDSAPATSRRRRRRVRGRRRATRGGAPLGLPPRARGAAQVRAARAAAAAFTPVSAPSPPPPSPSQDARAGPPILRVHGAHAAGDGDAASYLRLNMVRAVDDARAAEIRALLDGVRTAADIEEMPAADIARLEDMVDDVPCDLSPQLERLKEELREHHRARNGFDEPSLDSVKPRDELVQPLRITKAGQDNPPYEPPRRLNAAKLEALRKYLQELLARGFIKPSSSSFGAPVLLVVKSDGTFRFTVDYRALNSVLEMDRFGLPRQDQILEQVRHAGAKVFSALDAFHSFWQVKLPEEDRHKTAMTTPFGLYEWTVCPQGLATSPSTLQRVLVDALGDLVGTICAVYVDDILIYSRTPEEHAEHLRLVLDALHRAQIRIKEKKCKLFYSSLEYLGVRLTGEGTSPTASKIRQLLDFPEPESRQDVRSLLGVVSWLRDYIPHVVTWMTPLQELANSKEPWGPESWQPSHRHCLQVLIHLLISEPVLRTPDPARPFAVMTDASQYALGCVLMQQASDDPGSLWHPVAYHSKAIKPRKQHRSATDREMMAIIEGVRKWEHLLADQTHVTIFGDHKPLSHYRTMDLSSGHNLILRQLDRLEALRSDIVYVTGKEVALADLLSRDARYRQLEAELDGSGLQHPVLRFGLVEGPTTEHLVHLPFGVQPASDLSSAAVGPELGLFLIADWTSDESLDRLRSAQAKSELATSAKPATGDVAQDNGVVRGADGLLWHVSADKRRRLFLPTADFRQLALVEAHDVPSAGHLGHQRTYERLDRYYWWPTIKKDVREYCRTCAVCLATKPGRKHMGALQPLPIPFRKWAYVSMDFVSIPGNGLYKSAMVVCDMLTKRIRVFPSQERLELDEQGRESLSAKQAAELYFDGTWRHGAGVPSRIVSDRDPRFTSHFWQELWSLQGTKLNMSTAGYPQTDGQTERSIRSFVQMLRAYASELGADWHLAVGKLEYAYNDSVHEATGYTPFELEFGQHPHAALQWWLHRETTGTSTGAAAFVKDMRDRLDRARVLVKEHQAKRVAEYQRGVVKQTVSAGDWVFVANRARRHKLDPIWTGPFRVSAVQGKVVSIERAGRKLAKVNMSVCRLFPPRVDFNDNRLSALRTVPHAEEEDVWVLEGRTATGAWLPVSSFPERDVAGWPSVWVTLSEVVDEDVARSSTLLWREESLGTKVLRTFPGGNTVEAVVVEFDLPACLKEEASYYIVHADGDDEDIGEGEFERDRQAYLKYRQSVRP